MLNLECDREISLSACVWRFKFVVVGELVVNTGLQSFTFEFYLAIAILAIYINLERRINLSTTMLLIIQHLFLLNWK